MRKIKRPIQILLLAALLVLFLTPALALAQDDDPQVGTTTETSLICKLTFTKGSGDTVTDCIRRVYNFALGIAGLIAMAVLVAAGYLYMTAGGDGEQLKTAKDLIGAVAAGIIILATAYILLRFLDPRLTELKEPLSPTGSPTSSATADDGTRDDTGDDDTPPATGATYTDEQARAELSANDIDVNASEPQTSLEGIKVAAIDEVISLKRDCQDWANSNRQRIGNCEVIVTGGTEDGHESGACSHESGNKVDLSFHTVLDRYIESTFRRDGSRDGNPRYIRPSTGAEYVKEINSREPHWDVKVGC